MSSSRLLKAFTLGFALTLSSQAFAGMAQQLLSEDLQASIKTLSRETRLYHYFPANLDSSLKKAKNRYELVSKRAELVAESFWNLNNNQTKYANAGIGVYLAIDPFISSPANAADVGGPFGSSMMEITFNPGTKYLDLMKDVILREETINAIKSETGMSEADAARLLLPRREKKDNGEDGVAHKGFARDTLQLMAEKQNEKFRKLVFAVYSQNQIAMTEYGWQAATSAFCGSTVAHRSALVYVGRVPNAIKSVTMVLWNQHSYELDAQESEALERNRKLFSLLQPVRSLEKNYVSAVDAAYTAKKSGDKATAKQLTAQANDILTNIKASINSVYPDENELNDLRSKTFECVK